MARATTEILDGRKREAEGNATANGHRLGAWTEYQETLQSKCINGGCKVSASIGTSERGTIVGSATWSNTLLACPA